MVVHKKKDHQDSDSEFTKQAVLQYCNTISNKMTQLHKIDPNLIYLKSADQELSNEVYIIHIKQLKPPSFNPAIQDNLKQTP